MSIVASLKKLKYYEYLSLNRYGYVGFLITGTGLLFIKNFVYAAIMSVNQFGIYSKYFILSTALASYAGLGIQQLAHKRMPQILFRGHGLAAGYMVLGGVLIFITTTIITTTGIYAFIWSTTENVNSIYGITVAAVNGLCLFLYTYVLISAKSELRFGLHGKIMLARATILLAAGVITAVASDSGMTVLAVESISTFGFVVWWFCVKYPMKDVIRRIRLPRLLRWLRSVSPHASRLLILNGTLLAGIYLDRWLGAVTLSDTKFGVYSAAALFLTGYQTLQAVLNVSVYPRMSRLIAHQDIQQAFGVAKRISLFMWAVTIILYLPCLLIAKYLVLKLWPDYSGIEVLIPVLMLAGTLRAGDYFGSFCILCNAEMIVARKLMFFYIMAVLAVIVSVIMVDGNILKMTIFASLAVSMALITTIVHIFYARKLVAASIKGSVITDGRDESLLT